MTLQAGKECSCGITWTKLPSNIKPWIDDEMKLAGKDHIIGYFFNCTCNSTLFIAQNNLQMRALIDEATRD